MENVPILLAINAGVSFASTGVFPRNLAEYSSKNDMTLGSVLLDGIISNN